MNRKIIWYLLLFIFVLFGFRFGCHEALHGLDGSWVYALNDIHIKGTYIFGKDVFFTFGPLGYLLQPFCCREIVIQAFIFKMSIIIAFVFSLFCFRKRKNSNIFLALIALNFVCFGCDMFEFLAVMLAMVCLLAKNRARYAGLILLNLLACFMLFAKFNIGITCIATLIFTIIALRFKKEFVLVSSTIWAAGLLLITYFYFGNLSIFLNWFKVSLTIASGYSEAMLWWHYLPEQIYLVFALVILGLFFNLWINDLKNNGKYSKIFLVIFPSMFFMFKSGFVRADMHKMLFFTYILAVVPVLYFFVKNISVKKLIIMYILALILPISHISTGCVLSFISKLKHGKGIYATNEYLLPADWVRDTGKAKIEFLPFEFGYIEKNKIIAHYNPILQLYSVYTRELDMISAADYTEQQTDFIVIDRNESIDGRNMILDNPATWDAIRENYYVRDFKSNKILLAKKTKRVSYTYKTFEKGSYKINEDIFVPKTAKKAVVNLELSPIGGGANFLFKLLPLYMYINYNDNETVKLRVVRDVMKNGIYVDELVLTLNDLDNWLREKETLKNINSIKFYTVLPFLYKKNILIEWQK